jgi:hypothetical protein
MTNIFNRPMLAAKMAQQLLRPGILDEGLRSGLLLSGVRRTGKTTFLMQDLVPALEQLGALVVYVDLWSDALASPDTLVNAAVRKTLAELQTPSSNLLKRLNRLSGVDAEAFGFKFGFKLDSIGAAGGTTLAQAFTEVVDHSKTDVVLIIDEVQHAIATEEGKNMLLALKAAREAINSRAGTPGHFIFIGTGSHRAQVSELRAGRKQAFEGAISVDYPLLDGDYVAHLLQRLSQEGIVTLPSPTIALDAFRTLGNRPEEMLRALRQLTHSLPVGGKPDDYLPVIAATLRSTAADIEFRKIEELGELAKVVFDRITNNLGEARGVYSKDAAAIYSAAIGREVSVEELQPIINNLLDANLIMRKSHGVYGVTDPYFQELWKAKKALEGDEFNS